MREKGFAIFLPLLAIYFLVAQSAAWAQRIELDPPGVVVVRSARRTVNDENRFVARFIAASSLFRAPVRAEAIQRAVDSEVAQEGSIEAGRRALEEAVDAYGRLDSRAGLKAIARAETALGAALLARGEAKRAVALLAQTHLAAGAFHIAIGNQQAADAAFESALGFDAGVRYDAARFSPTLARGLDAARARFLQRVPVVTLVVSRPPGAVVELAGVPMGETPLKLRVRPGNRSLVLRRAGFAAVAMPIVGEVPPELSADLVPTRLVVEWNEWCEGVVEAGASARAGAEQKVPASLGAMRHERSLVVIEADARDGFTVCGLVGSAAPAFGVRIANSAPANDVAAFWREHDRVHRRFVLKRLTDRDALDVTPITNAPPGVRAHGPPRWYERWWVWAAVGAVVAGGTVGVVLGARGPSTSGIAIRF